MQQPANTAHISATVVAAECYRDANTVFSLAVMLVEPKQFMGPTQLNSLRALLAS
jgi:hypothetical protein